MKKKTGSFFVIPALLGLTVTQAQSSDCKEPGINVNYMDKTVKPANDFSDM
jgi:endothelin-converting enzyme/putative endopeptidase